MLAQVDQTLFQGFTYLHGAEVVSAAGSANSSNAGGGMRTRPSTVPTMAEKEALMKSATLGKGATMGGSKQTSEEAKRALLKKALASHQ